jgi:putative oxidoreductase
MTSLQSTTVLVGRILLGLLFVLSGFAKISGFDGTAGYIGSKGLPLAATDRGADDRRRARRRAGADGRALHAPGRRRARRLHAARRRHLPQLLGRPQPEQMAQQINFMKNLAIAGGMLVLAAFGPGRLSLDARRLASA